MRYECEKCGVKIQCKMAFGKFWNDKSSSGVGCNFRFPGFVRKQVATEGRQEKDNGSPYYRNSGWGGSLCDPQLLDTKKGVPEMQEVFQF